MIINFKCCLADGSQITHSYDLGQFKHFEQFVSKMVDAIEARLQAGRPLIMPNPNILYAPGQVRYVELIPTEDDKASEESTREEFKRKMGFVKD